jgi:hypothetical protein
MDSGQHIARLLGSTVVHVLPHALETYLRCSGHQSACVRTKQADTCWGVPAAPLPSPGA